MKLKAGDPITLVEPDFIICTEVANSNSESTSFSTGYDAEEYDYTEEGTAWLRGYHLPDSSEVSGARTAIALLAKQVKTTPNLTGTGTLGTQVIHGALAGALGALIHHSLAKKKGK